MECYEHRLGVSIHHSLSDANERLKVLTGKDRYAVHSEFLDWLVMDTDSIVTTSMNQPITSIWGKEFSLQTRD